MKPRTIIIVAIAALLIICIGAYFLIASRRNGMAAGVTTVPAGAGYEATLPASQAIPDAPTTPLLTIGTANGSVQVNNFYLADPDVTDGGDTVIIASTTEYEITYDTIGSSFWIGIDPAQFNAVRPAAEQAFLATLGVTTTAACKLDVSVGAFYSATSTLSGQSFPLSFCTTGAATAPAATNPAY